MIEINPRRKVAGWPGSRRITHPETFEERRKREDLENALASWGEMFERIARRNYVSLEDAQNEPIQVIQ